MFDTVLIANRGEIARRVLDTCRRLGIRTVAVYSDADANEPHVQEADEAVRLGPAPASESYLDVEAVIEAARRSGADAIHPGYGFLSENAAFPEACEKAGIVFVGPAADAIRLMGDKAAAKRELEQAGVPVVPGVHDDDLGDDAIAEAADQIGYPVLLKAVAGGGGKGMRAVHDPADLQEALEAARREAAGAFGDDRMIVERLVSRPRHVEIQILGDTHGSVVHVLERECSIQRRHQKVVEESPSPALSPDLRDEMGAAAVRAAEAIGYHNAGTVEFIFSDQTNEFFFLEMNTRLQVEHPVTELVTGLDLVELQLRVAAGEPLPFNQDDIRGTGHAIECRLYAEDPANDYLPQTGRVLRFATPTGTGIRVDSGVVDGSEVSRFYDPMLAKLVVHADDRAGAIERMRWLLRHTIVLGVVTNLELLTDVVSHEAFADGALTTSFLDEHLPDWAPDPAPDEVLVAAAVALEDRAAAQPATSGVDDPYSPWRALGPWRTGRIGGWRLSLDDRGTEVELDVRTGPGDLRIQLDGRTVPTRLVSLDPHGTMHLDVDGHEVPATVAIDGTTIWVHAVGRTRRLEQQPSTRHVAPGMAAGETSFTSPMPGAVLKLNVEAGDRVEEGATLVVVEAMKMEHPVVAPGAGTVTEVHVAEGQGVEAEQALLDFEPDPSGDHEEVDQ